MKENTSIIKSDDVELQETFKLLIYQACIYMYLNLLRTRLMSLNYKWASNVPLLMTG